LLRTNAQGQQCLTRWETQHGQGTAWTILAHQVARAGYSRLLRGTVFEMDTLLQGYGSRAGEPAAYLDTYGLTLTTVLGNIVKPCGREREEGHRLAALIPRG
jgi:hypothetical protein